MKKSSALAYVGHNANMNRKKADFYPSPRNSIEELLKKEILVGEIWECACGDGALSKVIEEKGYKVYSSDLIDRGYGTTGIDFLKSTKKADTIITNPPFNLSTEFTLKAFELSNRYIIFLNKLSFLEGIRRRKKIFNQGYLKNVYVFSQRLKFGGNGLMAFAWYVFDKKYSGKPLIDWI
tara:strand:- start:49 stop:585 length:537 start_codon:yes stop_codon:yes gene_type:complete